MYLKRISPWINCKLSHLTCQFDSVLIAISALLLFTINGAEGDELTYQVPPKPIADLVNVPPTPATKLSPDRKIMLLMEKPSLPPIALVSQPELKLAGLRINPKTNGPSRAYGYARLYLCDVNDPNAKPIAVQGIPDGARISDATWSPDGTKVGFTVNSGSEITLWILDVASRKVSKLIAEKLNDSYYFDAPYKWVSDGSIIAKLIPANRGPEPVRSQVPRGPIVQENNGQKRPARTEPDLLKNPDDEKLLEYFLQSQLAHVYLDGGVEPIDQPALYMEATPSPDAQHLLTEIVHRPYSYKVSIDRFPYLVEIRTIKGKVEKPLADNPLAEEVPIDFSAVPTGPRSFDWRSDADATICWVEALDGGDPKKEAAVRDQVFTLAAPFTEKPKSLVQLDLRCGSVTWGTGDIALVSESWFKNRKTKTFVVAPDNRSIKPRLLWDRSYEDHYSDPGNPALDLTPRGTSVIHLAKDGSMLLFGDGAGPEGDRPFVDKLDLRTSSVAKRLWRCDPPFYEYPFCVLDRDGEKLLTRRESVSQQPQYFLRKLPEKSLQRLTDFPNPNASLANVKKRLLQYKRADGVKLSGMLYLPANFIEGKSQPLPMLMWAYPTEFKSKDAAGQVQDSPYKFVSADYRGPLFALLMGYAILDDPTFPIVGEGTTEPNDTYVPQLIAGAEAAVNEVVRLGVADRHRLAIGGHSYGAFTTANLLAHSNLFRTGIARSGAYNRTLTPFGFQSEERNFWQAKSIYVDMSPFTFADKIDEPLLLIHGEVDNNPGTYPIQSERLFEAMKGLGGRVRWVVLPAETHGYTSRESVLHTLWEMNQWLDKHVTNAK
ncbi:S9 family peptidase [soil metagenome]